MDRFGLRPALVAWCVWLVLTLGLSDARAANGYYAGKRITLLVNFAAGGSTDIQGRLFAKYLAKHLAANLGAPIPPIIVQNMEGGGGITGVNYLGEIAPKDGTMIGYYSGTAWEGITDPEHFRIDYRTYEFVAYEPGTTIYFARRDVPPGLREPADIVKAQGLVIGGLSANADKDLRHRLTLDLLGVPFRYVTGYQSSAQARHALESREIHFYSEAAGTYRSVIDPELVKGGAGEVLPLYYDPRYDGTRFSVPKAIADMTLVSFPDLYRQVKGTMPSGPLWDAYLSLITVTASMQRLIVLPPNAPAAALDALREAIAQLNDDKELEAEGLKIVGYRPEYITGADIRQQVDRALSVTPETLRFLATYRNERPK